MHLASSGSLSRVLHLLLTYKETQLRDSSDFKSFDFGKCCLSHTHKHMHVHINTFKCLHRATFKESLLLLPRSSTSYFK